MAFGNSKTEHSKDSPDNQFWKQVDDAVRETNPLEADKSYDFTKPASRIETTLLKGELGWFNAKTILKTWIKLDPDALMLVYACLFGLGIIAYFSLPNEPILWVLALTTASLFALWQRISARGAASIARLLLATTLLFSGASIAQWRVQAVQSPMLQKKMTGQLEGVVVGRESMAKGGYRYEMKVKSFADLTGDKMPQYVRVSTRSKSDPIAIGQHAFGVVQLLPHTGPAYPNGYDFAFPHYFSSRGALGFTFGALKAKDGDGLELSVAERLRVVQSRARTALAARIRANLPGTAGHLAVALITGERTAIPQDVTESLRASGLAHILAISGLHMGLIAGTAFFMLRLVFALIPGLSLNYPVKKYAAAAALLIATNYLFISGGGIATQRAFITLAVMLTAMLVDRRALSLRNIGLAAFLVLFLQPEALFSPGFQMSFAAVASLVAAHGIYQRLQERGRMFAASPYQLSRTQGLLAKIFGKGTYQRSALSIGGIGATIAKFMVGLAITSLIAGSATAIFAAFHFQRVAPAGMLANIIAMPFVTLVVMPAGLLSMIAAPFGLDALALLPMGWGIEKVLAAAQWSNGFGPSGLVGIIPLSLFLGLFAALAAMVILKGRSRLLCVVPAIFCVLLYAPQQRPVLLISSDGKLSALQIDAEQGGYLFSSAKTGRFTRDIWRRAYTPKTALDGEVSTQSCDSGGCFQQLNINGERLSFAHIRKPENLREDCQKANIAVIAFDSKVHCEAALVITLEDLKSKGAAAFYIDANAPLGLRLQHSNPTTNRPWNIARQ